MLTPAFTLTQDQITLVIEIKAPYAKVAETEIFVDDKDFKFYSKPYYLRLSLPGSVVEDGRETAKYDCDTGTFCIRLPKVHPGVVFEGLDMITKLLAPSGEKSVSVTQPLIEVIDKVNDSENLGQHSDDADDEEFDWQIEQEPYREDLDAIKLDQPKYGFANLRSAVLKRIQSEFHDIIDLSDADITPACDRRKRRLADEQDRFDEDYYLFDLYQNDAIPPLLKYKPPWSEKYKRLKDGEEAEDIVTFSEKERQQMRNLPRKEYLLDTSTIRTVFLGLVDIIFAYCYNHRTTEGENTVESGWTIAKLSASLSWLDTYSCLRDVLVTSYRRCLCFPLYRHWKLTQKVQQDMLKIFALGRRRLLKCLLEIHDIMIHNDPQYILNDLFITDYCVWIQSVSTKQLESLVRELTKVKVQKKNLFLELDLLENAAELAAAEDQEMKQVANTIKGLNIHGQTDRQEQLADQIKELSVRKGTSTEVDQGNSSVNSSLLHSERQEESESESSPESSSEESDSSEYTTASEDGDDEDSETESESETETNEAEDEYIEQESSQSTQTETQVEKTMKHIFEESEQTVKQPLITEITADLVNDNTKLVSESPSKCAMDSSSLNF